MTTNYFRLASAPVGHRVAHTVVPFDDRDATSTQAAFDRIRELAAQTGAAIVAWRTPKCEGPWTTVPVVGLDHAPWSWERAA